MDSIHLKMSVPNDICFRWYVAHQLNAKGNALQHKDGKKKTLWKPGPLHKYVKNFVFYDYVYISIEFPWTLLISFCHMNEYKHVSCDESLKC